MMSFANYLFSYVDLVLIATKPSRPTLHATRTKSSQPTFSSISPRTTSHRRTSAVSEKISDGVTYDNGLDKAWKGRSNTIMTT